MNGNKNAVAYEGLASKSNKPRKWATQTLEAILMIYFHPLTCWCIRTTHNAICYMTLSASCAQKLFQCICFVWTVRVCVCVCVMWSHRFCWWLPLEATETLLNHSNRLSAASHTFSLLARQMCEWKFDQNGFYVRLRVFFAAAILVWQSIPLPHTHTSADVFATTGHQTAQMTLKYPRILQHSADSQAHTHTLVFIAFSNIWSWYCLLDNAIITSRKLSTETIIGIHISKVGIPAFTYLKILLAWHGTKIPFQCEPLWLDRCKQSLIYACCRHL